MTADASGRLNEGRLVVGDLAEYAWASRQVGYDNSDLTSHPGGVSEWYDDCDGLDLGALDADTGALRAAAASAEDATLEQAEALTTVRGGWSGSGAGAAVDLLSRHQRSAESVERALTAAAETLTTLRDDLWRAIDARVAATLSVGAAADGRRAEWLAASRALTTGTGDRSAASELVDLEVAPFVRDVVATRWLAAMRASSQDVADAYDTALERLRAVGDVVFEVPAGFAVPAEVTAPGGTGSPAASSGTPVAAPMAPAATAPASWSPPGVATPAPAPAPALAEPTPTAAAPAPSSPSMGDPGGGLGSMGSAAPAGSAGGGLSGFGRQLADLISGAGDFGLDPGLGEGFANDDAEEQTTEEAVARKEEEEKAEEEKRAEEEKSAEERAEEEGEEVGESAEAGESSEEEVVTEIEPVTEPVTEPVAEPVSPSVEAPPLPPPPVEGPPPEQTPCEIAADELPQVGE